MDQHLTNDTTIPQADESVLEEIMSTLNAEGDVQPSNDNGSDIADEILEAVGGEGDESIDDLIQQTEQQLDQQALYAKLNEPSANPDESLPGDVPQPTAEPEAAAKPEKKAKGEKKPKQPKQPSTRVTYHGNAKSAVLVDRLAGKAGDVLVLEVADAALDPAALAAKQAQLKTDLDTKIAKKVGEKAIMLMSDIAAGRPIGNGVLARTLTVLARDGFVTTGPQGNVMQDLRKPGQGLGANKGLSEKTAASQSNQMFQLLPFLKMVVADGKGRYVVNPGSVLLASVGASMGLQFEPPAAAA